MRWIHLFEDHAGVVQSWDERRPVNFLRAAGPVTEADDVSAALLESGCEGQAFRVEGQGDESGFTIGVVAHQDGEFSVGLESMEAITDELSVTA